MKIFKNQHLVLVIATLFLFVIYGTQFLCSSYENDIPITASRVFSGLGMFFCCVLAGIVLIFVAYCLSKFIDKKDIKTKIQSWCIKLSEHIRTKNINAIYPPLLSFFYFVLERNNEFLKLPLGKDCSALIPNGYKPIYRQGKVFYIFQLVMPEEPIYDEKTLKELIQSYVDSELINYGIAGLSSCFKSRIYGAVPSVYVDRAFYNESQHMLNFALIYACAEDDVNYLIKARQRDKEETEAERTVYDDEL